jgi:hypothetical protein
MNVEADSVLGALAFGRAAIHFRKFFGRWASMPYDERFKGFSNVVFHCHGVILLI